MPNKIKLSEINAIIFDLGGVILNLNYDATINAFKNLGGEQFDELYTQAHQNKIFDQFETGQISTDQFLNYLGTFLPDHVTKKMIIDAWNAMLLDLPEHRVNFLMELKKTHQIFLFSNTNEIHYINFTNHVGEKFGDPYLLDEIFLQTYYSHKVKKRKPNTDAFQMVIDDHHLQTDLTLFIDDSIQHIEGASKVGLRTYHLVNEDIINIFESPKL